MEYFLSSENVTCGNSRLTTYFIFVIIQCENVAVATNKSIIELIKECHLELNIEIEITHPH